MSMGGGYHLTTVGAIGPHSNPELGRASQGAHATPNGLIDVCFDAALRCAGDRFGPSAYVDWESRASFLRVSPKAEAAGARPVWPPGRPRAFGAPQTSVGADGGTLSSLDATAYMLPARTAQSNCITIAMKPLMKATFRR
ncbi:unnamed protein product, partial [Iphiclides podalirius]